jgi:hypothetical protein
MQVIRLGYESLMQQRYDWCCAGAAEEQHPLVNEFYRQRSAFAGVKDAAAFVMLGPCAKTVPSLTFVSLKQLHQRQPAVVFSDTDSRADSVITMPLLGRGLFSVQSALPFVYAFELLSDKEVPGFLQDFCGCSEVGITIGGHCAVVSRALG